MFLKIAGIVINTNQLVHARVSGSEARRDREVVLVMTKGPEIELAGDAAERFLEALPAYEPEGEKEVTRTNDSPRLAYAEGRPEDARRLLLREYARKDVRRLIQLDGHRVGGGDDVMRPDEDGHSLTAGDDVGLYNIAGTDHMPVRILVCAEAEKTEVLRLLDKVRDWVERDYHGLRRMATESPAALAGLEAPADSGEVPDIPF